MTWGDCMPAAARACGLEAMLAELPGRDSDGPACCNAWTRTVCVPMHAWACLPLRMITATLSPSNCKMFQPACGGLVVADVYDRNGKLPDQGSRRLSRARSNGRFRVPGPNEDAGNAAPDRGLTLAARCSGIWVDGPAAVRGNGGAAPDGYAVLTTTDRRCLRMFDLWFRYYRDTGIGWPVHVVAIGRRALSAMHARASRGQPLVVHPMKAGAGSVTVRRLHVLKALLDRGLDVVSTDLDALWLSRRTLDLTDRRFDVQISVTPYMWPREAAAAWGFSLCCGFSIIHSNAATRRLVDRWIAKSVRSDQKALNHILLDHGMRWKHARAVNGNQGVCRALDLTIEAIDYRLVTRAHDVRRIDRRRVLIFNPRLGGRNEEMRILRFIADLARLRPRLFLGPLAVAALFRAARSWVVSTIFGGRLLGPRERRRRG